MNLKSHWEFRWSPLQLGVAGVCWGGLSRRDRARASSSQGSWLSEGSESSSGRVQWEPYVSERCGTVWTWPHPPHGRGLLPPRLGRCETDQGHAQRGRRVRPSRRGKTNATKLQERVVVSV